MITYTENKEMEAYLDSRKRKKLLKTTVITTPLVSFEPSTYTERWGRSPAIA
jgi:hypothetical protein